MTERYTRTAAWLHWIIAVLIIVNIVIALSDNRLGSIRIHKAIGLTVLALSIIRLAWRLTHRPPDFPEDMSALERRSAKTLHTIFYVLMIAVPFAGWLLVSNASELRPLTWFGLFDLPYLAIGHEVYGPAKAAHIWLGRAFGLLLIGHIAAAARHHFIKRDGLLRRMSVVAG